MIDEVVYREVPGLTGYEAGTDGSVWSRWKMGGRGVGWVVTDTRRKRLSAHPASVDDPHLKVTVRRDGRRQTTFVHRLVLEAFVGPCPDGLECRHRNGNPTDNRLSNIEWATRTVNQGDRVAHGTRSVGVKNGKTTLTEADVLRLVALRATGLSHGRIAADTGTPKPTVSGILSGRTWSHLTGICRADEGQY